MNILLHNGVRGYVFECFSCNNAFKTPFSLTECPSCGEVDNVHLMD